MAPAKGVVVISSLTSPRIWERWLRSPLAILFGAYPRSLATFRTCCCVAAFTRKLVASLRACDTVVTETPAALATSRIPTLVVIDFLCKTFCFWCELRYTKRFAFVNERQEARPGRDESGRHAAPCQANGV